MKKLKSFNSLHVKTSAKEQTQNLTVPNVTATDNSILEFTDKNQAWSAFEADRQAGVLGGIGGCPLPPDKDYTVVTITGKMRRKELPIDRVVRVYEIEVKEKASGKQFWCQVAQISKEDFEAIQSPGVEFEARTFQNAKKTWTNCSFVR